MFHNGLDYLALGAMPCLIAPHWHVVIFHNGMDSVGLGTMPSLIAPHWHIGVWAQCLADCAALAHN
jgi:hypothetical protein